MGNSEPKAHVNAIAQNLGRRTSRMPHIGISTTMRKDQVSIMLDLLGLRMFHGILTFQYLDRRAMARVVCPYL